MSLDGFIARPDDRPGQELGRRGGRLFNRLDDLTDPDGYRIELVEWPTGHGSGITPEDFA